MWSSPTTGRVLPHRGKVGRVAATVLAISACAPLPVAPYTVEIKDESVFNADNALCRGYALATPHSLSLGAVATATASGALSNAPAAVASPLVPAIGAAGAGGASLITQLGLFGTNQLRVYLRCMYAKGDRSGKYLVLEPLP